MAGQWPSGRGRAGALPCRALSPVSVPTLVKSGFGRLAHHVARRCGELTDRSEARLTSSLEARDLDPVTAGFVAELLLQQNERHSSEGITVGRGTLPPMVSGFGSDVTALLAAVIEAAHTTVRTKASPLHSPNAIAYGVLV